MPNSENNAFFNNYPSGTNDDDKKCAHALIDAILANTEDLTINIHNGDTYEIADSRDKLAIVQAMATSDEDYIYVYNSCGEQIGFFYLIYSNGSEGEPMILISDYSSNDYCDNIWDALNKKFS